MGKWDTIKSKFKALPPDAEFQVKVDEVKRQFKKLPIPELAKRLDRDYRRKKQLEEQEKLVNISIEACNQLLIDAMDREELEQIRTRSGILFYKQTEPHAVVEDQGALFKWIKAARAVYLLQANWQRLNALVKDRIVAGQTLPAGVRVYIDTSIRRRGKGKQELG